MNRRILLFLPGLALLIPASHALGGSNPKGLEQPGVTAVSHVDLSRYTGLWHEIARTPNRFQKGCVRGTTAEYTLLDNGRIRVVNRCVNNKGQIDEAVGEARIVDTAGNAKLEVSFVIFLGWRPFWGDYRVLGLDPDYRWAAIGDPQRKYGWILARKPVLDPGTLDEIFLIFERNGYGRERFQASRPWPGSHRAGNKAA
ncbi:hypothetical protein CO151_09935 [bacterium CG_4_9_14_3_um_filter_65_15]|nr:MAG: hypothetical protein CO151_09935 [bacterium CG_4_9_14_3_um_filter_65_15]